MSKTHYLLLVQDITNNCEFVYNTTPFEKERFEDECDIFFYTCIKELQHLPNVRSDIHDTHAELYTEIEVKNVGWVWSSI